MVVRKIAARNYLGEKRKKSKGSLTTSGRYSLSTVVPVEIVKTDFYRNCGSRVSTGYNFFKNSYKS
jgi:hypothetical protein